MDSSHRSIADRRVASREERRRRVWFGRWSVCRSVNGVTDVAEATLLLQLPFIRFIRDRSRLILVRKTTPEPTPTNICLPDPFCMQWVTLSFLEKLQF